MRDPRGLIALSAVRHRCEIRGIGFGEDAIIWNEAKNLFVLPVLEGDDAAKRDIPGDLDCGAGARYAAGKAVQDTDDSKATSISEESNRVVLGVAGVHHQWK